LTTSDHWDGADLIYTGRGKVGDQQRDDVRNLDVAENRRPLSCSRRLARAVETDFATVHHCAFWSAG